MNKVKSQIRDLKQSGVKLIEGNDQVRSQKCLGEIDAVLESYDCTMMPEFLVSGGKVSQRIKIIAKPRDGKADSGVK